MNKIIKQKWLENLRSGKYTQIYNGLTDCNGGFCTLGVLCDTIDSTQWQGLYYKSNLYTSWNDIPHDLAKQIGLTPKDRSNIIYKNDISKLSFIQMADFIEQYISEE